MFKGLVDFLAVLAAAFVVVYALGAMVMDAALMEDAARPMPQFARAK